MAFETRVKLVAAACAVQVGLLDVQLTPERIARADDGELYCVIAQADAEAMKELMYRLGQWFQTMGDGEREARVEREWADWRPYRRLDD